MIVEVSRTDLAAVRVVPVASEPLAPGRARIDIDAFALSSNNITYAVFGDAMRYWDFFPSDDPVAWGRVPVWGFGTVVESISDACAVGERVYGYFPMASELVVEPGRSDDRGFSDVAPHRAPMAGAYNRYVWCATDAIHRADRERQQMLLYPLFFTSFLVDDSFADDDDATAPTVIVSSASSKTAIGVAYLTHGRGRRVVGLTSARNREFVEALGIYDRVVDYDAIDGLEQAPAVFVDIAGNRDVLRAVHTRLADVLVHSLTVGDTHWDHRAAESGDAMPGPAPAFFFAPGQIKQRTEEWGRDELDRRIGEAWNAYSDWTDGWVRFHDAQGPDAVVAAYSELLAGTPDPRTGFIGSLRSSEPTTREDLDA
jgi:hypothetical protein